MATSILEIEFSYRLLATSDTPLIVYKFEKVPEYSDRICGRVGNAAINIGAWPDVLW